MAIAAAALTSSRVQLPVLPASLANLPKPVSVTNIQKPSRYYFASSASAASSLLVFRRRIRQRAQRGLESPHLPPPEAPVGLAQIHWDDYSSHLLLAVALTCTCGLLASMTSSLLLAGVAGAIAVPIVIFQHDVRHLHHKNNTLEEHLSDILVVLTGTCYGILPWSGVHVKHHAFTGNYRGAVFAESLSEHGSTGDLDDLAGPLRHGNPFGITRGNPILRAIVAASCIFLTMSLFQCMFVLQSLVGPFQNQLSESKRSLVIWKGALLTFAHVCVALLMLGPMGYMMYSIGMSACLTLLTAPVHHAHGVEDNVKGGFYAQQIAGTANIADHDSPLINYFMMGNDYHIEHHLWPRVPGTKKAHLAPYAKAYCAEHGLEYREVSLVDAWKQWALEVWTLAGRPYQSNAYGITTEL